MAKKPEKRFRSMTEFAQALERRPRRAGERDVTAAPPRPRPWSAPPSPTPTRPAERPANDAPAPLPPGVKDLSELVVSVP
jgi:hypothetical protein